MIMGIDQFFRSAALLLALFTISLLTIGAQAQDRERAILVLDGSGSMWGQIDGVSKIEIARGEIAQMLTGWDKNIDLGLMTYGHRTKGDCNDIELVVPPQPLNGNAFQGAVNSISPKGKTPLSTAVRLAAEEMRFTEERATVVLLSDGLETCEADPCALASSLEAQGVDFTAHVIGFDISANEAKQLSCLAENTGGQFFLAGNSGELTEALAQTVQTIAVTEPEPAPEPVVVAEAKPEPAPAPAGPQGIQALAKLCETCDFLEKDVFWYLYEAKADANGKRKEINRNNNAQPIFETGQGEYHLGAKYGEAYVSSDFTVSAGQLTEGVINLNAGNLRVRAEAAPGGTSLNDKMFYYVYEAKKDLEGKRKEVSRSGAANHVFRLPAGEYHIVAIHGKARATADLTVEAGALTDHVFDMNAGYLRITGVPTSGAEPLKDNQFYYVFEAKKDLEGNRREVDRSGAAQPLFRLSAGDYHVVATHGKARTSFDVTIGADQLSDETVDMNVGYLRIANLLAEGQPPLDKDVFYYVYEAKKDLEGKRKEVDRSGNAKPLFRLSAGDYHVLATYGNSSVTADLTVDAGALTDQTMVQNAGVLRAETVLEEGGAALDKGVFWYVMSGQQDLEGKRAEITRSGNAKPIFRLKEGSYQLNVRYGNETYSFPMDVSAGEVKDASLLLKK